MMVYGVKYLMENLPDAKARNTYYWYYSTQVLHNYSGNQWDTWNRAMRKLLISTQVKDRSLRERESGPEQPAKDVWGEQGGRLMTTALSCLTLEVYYRNLSPYKLDAADKSGPPEETPGQ